MERAPMSSPQQHSSPKPETGKQRSKCLLVALATILLVLPNQPGAAHKAKFDLTVNEKQPTLLGRVTNSEMKPLGSVQLRLSSPDNSKVKASTATKDDGSFQITHDPCKICQLEVLAPKNSGLASALLDNLSGETTRRLIIQLRAGLQIDGKVVGQGKGLKGLDLSFIPVDESTSKRVSVHGSGLTKTGKDGSFSVIVTPGLNRLTIENDRYPDFAKHFDTQVKVTTSGGIPDVTLPLAQN
jgi:hypothetical protein